MAELPSIEGFRILEEIGSGTFSSVFVAREEPLGRRVALKVLKDTIAPTSPFARQFEREASILAELSHPNIGLLYRFCRRDPLTYLVLEFVDGFSLADLARKSVGAPSSGVAAIGAAIARGLAHAHAAGVVHRDIKPANVLLSKQGEVKIFDFGIAHRVSSPDEGSQASGLAPPRVEDATAFGTPAYMSPEQILGETVDARSDVFSLGVVLYQLVSGARPFERSEEGGDRPAAHRIRRAPPIPLHRRAPEVPNALERIVMRAIEKLPADRFQSADEMAEELERLSSPRSGLRGDRLVLAWLARTGAVRLPDVDPAPSTVLRRRSAVRRATAGLAILGATAVFGGGVLQATSHHRDEEVGEGNAPLELVPSSPGFLRVLATPWAEVWVDGQRVDVTPFARSIPLPAGTHYVTLVHPKAQAERRTITLTPGETRTIDVVMAVPDSVTRDETPVQSAEREKKR